MTSDQRSSATAMQLEKRNAFHNDVLFIDGLWGTGKSLLGPIVSGMAGVEKVKVESLYEYISWLFYLGKIDRDGALWMLRTYADCSQYHNTIGREVNLRWSDDTGLKNAPDRLKYITRLFGGEGDGKVDEINTRNLAYCAMSHMLMLTPELLPLAYGNRVKVIEMVRHPLYMVNHFAAYLGRFESPREFTMAFYSGEVKVPWFARGWEAEFVGANQVERAVLSITRLSSWLFDKIEEFQVAGLSVLLLPFEEAVFATDRTLAQLQQFTGRRHHRRIASILKRQMLPRQSIAKGRGHASYGWSSSSKSDRENYATMIATVRDHCSADLQHEMNQAIHWYNQKFSSRLSEFQTAVN